MEVHNNSSSENRCLWIGNLDDYITEYELLKIVRYFGDIEKFDLPTYRRGVNAGKSRRYAFVTYKYEKDATTAKRMLHNTKLHNRLISVCYSHAIEKDEENKNTSTSSMSVLSRNKSNSEILNPVQKIKAIESKLKSMETSSDILHLSFGSLCKNDRASSPPPTSVCVPLKRPRSQSNDSSNYNKNHNNNNINLSNNNNNNNNRRNPEHCRKKRR